MDTACCIEAVEEVLAKHGKPEILNSNQGSQLTCLAYTDLLKSHEIAISL
jgi:putative transposase